MWLGFRQTASSIRILGWRLGVRWCPYWAVILLWRIWANELINPLVVVLVNPKPWEMQPGREHLGPLLPASSGSRLLLLWYFLATDPKTMEPVTLRLSLDTPPLSCAKMCCHRHRNCSRSLPSSRWGHSKGWSTERKSMTLVTSGQKWHHHR